MVLEAQLKEAHEKMRKALAAARESFTGVRTGRATPHMVESLDVDYYGSKTPLNQIAGISVPDARLLVISPYDKNALSAIEKAIQASDLGINPSNDGIVIRLSIPPLTEERRKEMIKVIHQLAEEGRVAVRNVRRHSKDEMERLQKDGQMSEDDLKRSEKELQKLTDQHVAEIDGMILHKEKELLEI